MRLPFLNRTEELRRLLSVPVDGAPALAVVYGRRRLGKSRLIREALGAREGLYFVADERDAQIQRDALARELSRKLPGFDAVVYPDWDALWTRAFDALPSSSTVVLDEFPYLVANAAELPSILQRLLDRDRGPNLWLSGSSQRMMHGLVLDGAAPLYGRAQALMRLEPLPPTWIKEGLQSNTTYEAMDHWALWGGVPRYWELARAYETRQHAMIDLVLHPMGPLHREPDRLLADDFDDVARASSLLMLVGQGVQRSSELASRLRCPATQLSRPLRVLMDLGYLERELPFGESVRTSKRSFYRLKDPFLRFWFRFVEPNRSRAAAEGPEAVAKVVEDRWPHHLGAVWEDLVRDELPRITVANQRWGPGRRWWGGGLDRKPLEIDLVSQSTDDPDRLLVGEIKTHIAPADVPRLLAELRRKAGLCPKTKDKEVVLALFALKAANDPLVTGPDAFFVHP